MHKILVIVGPTASGKSGLGIKLAQKLHGEIVSADSRQVYNGLDIGTGKVTKREMQGVPHHMLDVAGVRNQFTVVTYCRMACKVIDDIISRGKLPIIVGGTGQYIDALTKGLIVPEVKPNKMLRAKLEKLTNDKLFKLLKQLDPVRARNIDKNNPRRLVRAIEIAKALGKVPALVSKPRYSPVVVGIRIVNDELRIKIKKRLDARLRSGMIAEVRRLREEGVSWKRLFDLGLEYRYISLYLQKKLSKSEMLEKLEREIVKYAKRQMTWFKRDKSILWLSDKQTVPLIAGLLRNSLTIRGKTPRLNRFPSTKNIPR